MGGGGWQMSGRVREGFVVVMVTMIGVQPMGTALCTYNGMFCFEWLAAKYSTYS